MEFMVFLLVIGVGVLFALVLKLQGRVGRLEQDIKVIRLRQGLGELPTTSMRSPLAAVREPAGGLAGSQAGAGVSAADSESSSERPAETPAAEARGPAVPPPPPPPFIPPRLAKKPSGGPSWEVRLGTQWMAWAGGLLFLVGFAFFLKYAYDNIVVDPRGRLAIGMVTGAAALVCADVLRRRGYDVLFQAITGTGIAIFYACIYFSFQVYHLTSPGFSFLGAILVTMTAIVLAVAHNAVAIAILGLIGGFLSPVLFSTGENHPYILFTYIATLDLVALGVAYFRRWRGLDVLAFAGTILMYQGWYTRYSVQQQLDADVYHTSVFLPALLFTTIFYLLFLLIPTLYSLARRIPEQWDGLTLVVANCVYALLAYYALLYQDYRMALGFVAVGQAVLVFVLARAWDVRVGRGTKTGESLLIIAMALVTLAIPLELRLYGIPIAWAIEGALFAYLGVRFDRWTIRVASVAAIVLSAGGLLYRLPLHVDAFTPVVNAPFGSWLVVIAAASVVGYLLRKDIVALPAAASLVAYVLGCMVITLETVQYWDDSLLDYNETYMFSMLAVWWAAIPAATIYTWTRWPQRGLVPLAYAASFVSAVVTFGAFGNYYVPTVIPVLNVTFLPRLTLLLAFWWMGWQLRQRDQRKGGNALEAIGHVLMAILLALELERWSETSGALSGNMARGLVTALWAVQALAMVWSGLIRRNKVRRILGLVLFLIIVGKVVVDMGSMGKVYLILSCMLSGLIFLVGAYVYQRFSARLLSDENKEGMEP